MPGTKLILKEALNLIENSLLKKLTSGQLTINYLLNPLIKFRVVRIFKYCLKDEGVVAE